MNELQIFNNPSFGEIRTIEEDGKILFCGVDVARALGYADPQDAIKKHCRYPAKRRVGVQTGIKADGTPSIQMINMNFIPEGDLYRITAASELPAANQFEHWIFDEVLPNIRKNGTYGLNTCPQPPQRTGELARYIKVVAGYMEKQGSTPTEIMQMIQKVSSQHGLSLPANVVKPSPYQLSLFSQA